jgi:hypothetical protein
MIRGQVRGLIEEMIRGELDATLSRPRYGRLSRHSEGSDLTAVVTGHRHGSRVRTLTGTLSTRKRRTRSKSIAKPSSASGGSSTKPSPTAWRKPATGYSPSPACRRASGAAPAPPTRSNGYTRSSSAGSKRRLCCRRRTRPPCCSGRCLLPARPTCAKSMVGKPSPQNPSISNLISPHNMV